MDCSDSGQGDLDCAVQGLNGLLRRIQAERDAGCTYDQIASLLGVSKGTVWRLHRGREPTVPETRRKLGLPDKLPAQVQWHTVRMCVECRSPFVSNSGKRKHCFRCVPYRDRSHPTGG